MSNDNTGENNNRPALLAYEGKAGKGRKRGGQGRTGRDTLDAATAGETTDGGLGDALNVVTEDLAVTLRSAFAEALAAFSACGRGKVWLVFCVFLKLGAGRCWGVRREGR